MQEAAVAGSRTSRQKRRLPPHPPEVVLLGTTRPKSILATPIGFATAPAAYPPLGEPRCHLGAPLHGARAADANPEKLYKAIRTVVAGQY
jgi:hypothetical protein